MVGGRGGPWVTPSEDIPTSWAACRGEVARGSVAVDSCLAAWLHARPAGPAARERHPSGRSGKAAVARPPALLAKTRSDPISDSTPSQVGTAPAMRRGDREEDPPRTRPGRRPQGAQPPMHCCDGGQPRTAPSDEAKRRREAGHEKERADGYGQPADGPPDMVGGDVREAGSGRRTRVDAEGKPGDDADASSSYAGGPGRRQSGLRHPHRPLQHASALRRQHHPESPATSSSLLLTARTWLAGQGVRRCRRQSQALEAALVEVEAAAVAHAELAVQSRAHPTGSRAARPPR